MFVFCSRGCTYYSATPASKLLTEKQSIGLDKDKIFVLNPDLSTLDGFVCVDGENMEHLIDIYDISCVTSPLSTSPSSIPEVDMMGSIKSR